MHEQRGKLMQQCLVKLIITIYVKNKSTVLFCSTFILYVKCAILLYDINQEMIGWYDSYGINQEMICFL